MSSSGICSGARAAARDSGRLLQIWEHQLNDRAQPYLRDHRLGGRAILSATVYLGMADALCQRLGHGRDHAIANMAFFRPCVVPENQALSVAVAFDPGESRFTIRIAPAEPRGSVERRHAFGTVVPLGKPPEPEAPGLASIRARLRETVPAEAVYSTFSGFGLEYANAYRGIQAVLRRDYEALGEIAMTDEPSGDLPFHPGLLDSCLQVILCAIPTASYEQGTTPVFVPVRVERFRRLRAPSLRLFSHARLRKLSAGGLVADVDVFDPSGARVFEVGGLRCVPLRPRAALNLV